MKKETAYTERGGFMIIKELLRASLRNEAKALSEICGFVDDEYEQAIDKIMNCKGKVVVTGIGKSGHVGQKIAASLSSTGAPAFFVHSAEAIHGDSGMIEARDIVILLSNSGETQEVLNVLSIIEKIGAKRIAITKNRASTLAQRCDAVLSYAYEMEVDHLGLAPTTSALIQLAIGDAVAVTLCKLKEFSQQDFYLYHPGGSLGRELSSRSFHQKEIDEEGA
jgi:arabinose-5-phosphate isomerase